MSRITLVGGMVVDGTGSPARKANVTISDGRIVALSAAGAAAEGAAIDIAGLVLSPGFIDIHSHADYTLLRDGRAESALRQGVTSVVTGNCGHGIAPASARFSDLVLTNILGGDAHDPLPVSWRSFGDYLRHLREQGVGPNVFPLVAHGALRMSIAGYDDRALDRAELLELANTLEGAMAAGAIGLSSGLEYAPGIAANEAELIGVAEGMKGFSGLYATHCRNRSSAMPQATAEAVAIAERGLARLQMSHFIRRPNTPDALAEQSWDILLGARERGAEVFADVFPFEYGPTPLSVLIPLRLRNCGPAEMGARLRDPSFRRTVLAGIGGMFETAVKNDLVKSMYIADDGVGGEFVGASLAQVADRLKTTPVEAAYWLLENAGQAFHCVTIVENWTVWQDLVAALEDNNFFIMGDGVTGAMADRRPALTLADWGYAPRFLSQFVRDGGGRIALENAIHRMTLGPARQVGLQDRGSVQVGHAADLVAFDYSEIRSDVSPTELKSAPRGIRHVFVNGVQVVRDGALQDRLPGVVGLAR